ncbi:WbuC family cupin fold metalloprotein [Patescibacteria group bacterium]|nr:WbuC family cupin fold metalloprotein [Patescibacteria group bacterium]
MNVVSDDLLDELTAKAKESPRKRAHFLFHEFHDPVQRMVNAMEPGTYIPPHKHENPDKIEAFVILRGRAACIKFDDAGKVTQVHIIDEDGPVYAVDIPPRTWHTFVSLKSGTALFEVVQGPYKPESHKNLAPWAPPEEKGEQYLKDLEKEVRRKIAK